MDIAIQRILNRKEGLLNLSNLGLTELPPLPVDLTELWCSGNKLTSLPNLPVGLTKLLCHENQLTSLPNLPIGLTKLWCHENQLTSLPRLPASLTVLICWNNMLESLPGFPLGLIQLDFSNNPVRDLLPLPESLMILNSEGILSSGGISYLRSYDFNESTFDSVKRINHSIERNIRRKQIVSRCDAIKEELMERAWHPDRLLRFIKYYGNIPQWNHELRKYKTFDFTTIDEVL